MNPLYHRPGNKGYECWLGYNRIDDPLLFEEYKKYCEYIVETEMRQVIGSLITEISKAIKPMLGISPVVCGEPMSRQFLILGVLGKSALIDEQLSCKEKEEIGDEGFCIKRVDSADNSYMIITGKTERGVLYGTFRFLGMMQTHTDINSFNCIENPKNPLRMIDQWDNLDGTIERGYAGSSIFYKDNKLVLNNQARIRDYARLLSSIGINSIVLNNVNVRKHETQLLTAEYLEDLKRLAALFREYSIKIFLSVNFASPVHIDGLSTADPLNPSVAHWWSDKAAEIYSMIPDFGGFLVKADSEFNPGPHMYNRTHADGANMLASALKPFNGLVIWRCFVYNCVQDWRDRQTDRARAAYDHFMPFDGLFAENVVLQIKNGPMDFQVREPVSPLLGAMKKTNQNIELQITQEYTGQQIHLFYLVPHWKEILDFDTFAIGSGSTVKRVADGSLYGRKNCGFAGVANIGDDYNWTGHVLAQANLYGFGRLAWNPDLSTSVITNEWISRTFGNDKLVMDTISAMLLSSPKIYENYTAPLGVGWMVNPGNHYGPSVDGYEYSRWGTYHRADNTSIGIDRTTRSGTGFTGQYFKPNKDLFESLTECPDNLLLFFHHVLYTHKLKSGETVIQHIYNSHFKGADDALKLAEQWLTLKDLIKDERFDSVLSRLEEQGRHSKEWRDQINTYFYRKSGINDEYNRTIY